MLTPVLPVELEFSLTGSGLRFLHTVTRFVQETDPPAPRDQHMQVVREKQSATYYVR